ncbi:interferon-induced very large GTPase 1-like [Mercenaria mercenaria]|uniref:interferon-induced very large GTPase 1-like n=1 Tax=Mercenaria mercenaria TaxID=6596 RepID=UPI00234F1ADF|nr:interferon-induced very large GTPase 1-like [Mercenaria mercenaria]
MTITETETTEIMVTETLSQIKVSALPDNTDEQNVDEMIFENEFQQDGGKVKSVAIDKIENSAVMEFVDLADQAEDPDEKLPENEVVPNVLTITETETTEIMVTETLSQIKVSALPDNTDEQNVDEMIFENEFQQDGGKVKSVAIDKIENSAVMEFVDLAEKADLMKNVEPPMIKVSGLPDNIDEEILEMVFENEKKQGGGKVKDVTIDVNEHTAVIEFEDPKAVEIVMSKRPITIAGTKLSVTKTSLVKNLEPPMIKVSGFPDNIDEEILEMVFENEKKQGGGKIKAVTIDISEHTAIIEFEDLKAVEIVMTKRPITIAGKELCIEKISLMKNLETPMIKVSGLPDHIDEEILEMVFENEKKQGGGKAKAVTIDGNEHSAIIEFENPKAVEIVMTKRPITIAGNVLSITKTSALMKNAKPSMIKVSGLPDVIDKEILEMVFENKKKQGGGKVKAVTLDGNEHTAIIEFEDPNAVDIVMRKRPITIIGTELSVTVCGQACETTNIGLTKIDSLSEPQGSDDAERSSVKTANQKQQLTRQIAGQQQPEQQSTGINTCKGQQAQLPTDIDHPLQQLTGTITCHEQPIQQAPGTVYSQGHTVQLLPGTGIGHEKSVQQSNGTGTGSEIPAYQSQGTGTFQEQPLQHPTGTFTGQDLSVQQATESSVCQNVTVQQPPGTCHEQPVQQRTGTGVGEQREHQPAQTVRCTTTVNETTQAKDDTKIVEEIQDDSMVVKEHILKKLGLSQLIGGNITIKDMTTVDPFENADNASTEKLPWVLLRRLMSVNCDAMDLRFSQDSTNLEQRNSSIFAMYDDSSKNECISPLDVFLSVFQCCDPMLKQLLYQKLYLCKMAVPFIYQEHLSSESVLAKWPLRALLIESKNSNGANVEVEMLDMSTRFISFARFGRPKFSKSKLLNLILSETGADTFYHRDCPLGTTKKYITDGYTEMFWLPTIVDTHSRFTETITFLNMRGNIKGAFPENECTFIAAITDIAVIICDIDSIRSNSLELQNSIVRFSAVLIVIANPIDREDLKLRDTLFEFERTVSSKKVTKLQITCTHIGYQEKSATDVLSDVTGRLSDYLKSTSNLSKSLEARIKDAGKFVPKLDENEPCIKARDAALSVIQTMEKEVDQQNCFFIITPVQRASSELSDLLKQRHREKDFSLHGQIKEKLTQIRYSHTEKVSESMQKLLKCITHFAGSYYQLQYFLNWLRYFLERKKRQVLPDLIKKNQLAWDAYWKIKKEDKPSAVELDKQEMKIKQLEGEIEKASFGIENMFREMYHICDAILLIKKDRAMTLYQVHFIADIIADMVLNGHVFELLDGHSFYMPTEWIKLVLNKVHKMIGEKKVLTMSVLGLQSSGKSTLLNAMFGLHFHTSSGRCTRGNHMQLLPIKQHRNVRTWQPFEYILVIDTEGLRAPELSNKNYRRDNELATIITGLGDMTILNVMGENTTELRDILQILVHAFLRLKLANERLDIQKSCYFIHQNVTDITASEKMKTGLQISIRNLDRVTEESALSEGISNIHTFNQVIEFDTETNVWYLPNLWQGNPPVARVNRKYSEAVVDICHKLVLKGLNETAKSFKSLNDIVVHTEDLWKGVLAEDFVFSFRNSLEKRAYVDLETKLKTELWTLENHVDGRFYEISQKQFSQCDDKNSLNRARSIIIADIKRILSAEEASVTDKMNVFFKTNNFKDTVIQWKQQTMNHIRSFCKELIDKKHQEVDIMLDKRAVDIMTNSMRKTHEEELRKRSIELANRLKSKPPTPDVIHEKFGEIWNAFVSDSLKSDTLKKHQVAREHDFIDILAEMHNNHPVMYEVLNKEPLNTVTNIPRLSNSFKLTRITEKDISVKTRAKIISKFPFAKSYHESSLFAIVKERLEISFVEIDSQIVQLCKEDNEVTNQKIKCFLKNVDNLINDIAKPHDYFTLKVTFKIKIGIFVSRFALARFENHNKEYNQTHGLDVRLKEYKQQVKERFYAHLDECKAEDTAARMFRISMEKFVFETVKGRLPLMVKHYLKSQLPQLKYHLIIEILTDLVDRDNFRDWVHYIENPKTFAHIWITEKSDKQLFDQESGKYYELASEEIEKCLKEINSSITQSGKHLDSSSVTIHMWIGNFLSNLKTYKVPRECFRDVVRELENANEIHVDYFTDMLAKYIKTSGKVVEDKFKQECQSKDTIKWTTLNPYTDVFEDIWGCPDQCIFCGEPCIKSDIHRGTTHNCLQHRPSGCRGVHQIDTLKISLTSCNFDVASNLTATCSLYNYLCNKPKREPCSSGRHPYKRYRQYLPNWDIEPSNDMEERSKFWMWHIAKYKDNLRSHYCIDVSDVPIHWGEITKEEACESLRSLYTKGEK